MSSKPAIEMQADPFPPMSSNSSDDPSPAVKAPWEGRALPGGRRLLRRLLPLSGLILLVLAVLWGLWPKPVQVELGEVAKRSLTVRVSEEGKTRVRNRYVLTSPVGGNMERVLLKAGDPVSAGATLITRIRPVESPLLDPRMRVQAEAAVAMARAQRERSVMALGAAKLAATLAIRDRDRVRQVVKAGTYSESARERFENEAAISEAEWRAAEFSLQVAEGEVLRAEAALLRPDEAGEAQWVALHSPVSGVVLKVMQESAMPVQPGLPIVEIGDPRDIEIEAEILSRDAVGIRPGDSVSIEQWGGELALQGRVRRIEPAAFTKISALGVEEQRVLVLIDLIDPPEQARALGDRFRVEVRVAVWHADEVLAIPAGALFRKGKVWHTYVYQDGRALLRRVEVGQSDGSFGEVLGGIAEGERVLLHPPDVVRNRSAVKPRDQE